MRSWLLALLFLSSLCIGQPQPTVQRPLDANQIGHLQVLFNGLGNLEISPELREAHQARLVAILGLNEDEASVLKSGGAVYTSLLSSLQQNRKSILADKSSLAPADRVALDLASQQFSQAVASLANQVLRSLRPETATRLLSFGNVVVPKTPTIKESN